MTARFYLFDTPFGASGFAFTDAGICAVAFPTTDAAAARARLQRRAPDAENCDSPPVDIASLAENVVALFNGDRRDLSDARLDFAGLSVFDSEVYRLTLKIPAGETRTYGDIARDLGDPGASRRVGQALGRNPFPVVVPCHRVIGADGRMTGFSAPGGLAVKRRLLALEGALAPDLFDSLSRAE